MLASETDKALRAIGPDTDRCIYIQGDEVIHEDGYAEIKAAMEQWKNDPKVDGLLFNYRHFYGSFDYIGASSRWYKHEIRVIKNDPAIFSYRDAQGFRKKPNQKLRVKPFKAYVHHYGWVREPEAMQAKNNNFGRYYHGGLPENAAEKMYTGSFDYSNTSFN